MILRAVATLGLSAVSGGQTSDCSKPRRNEACWTPPFSDTSCCGPHPEYDCWSPPFTDRRCCQVAPMPSSCTDADMLFLEDLQEFFDTGILPSGFQRPVSPQEVTDWLLSNSFDEELERCASATLARLLTMAETIADLDSNESIQAAATVMTQYGLLAGAARARGALRGSDHLFPENVAYQLYARLTSIMGLHSDADGMLNTFLNFTGYADTEDNIWNKGCLADAAGVDGCTRASSARGGERGRKFIMQVTQIVLAHRDYVLKKEGIDPTAAAEAVVLAQLIGAADMRGIRDEHAKRLLTHACRDLVLSVPRQSQNFDKLQAGAISVANAIALGTRGQYAEKDKDDIILNFVDALGTETAFYAEIGVGPSGRECNTRVLRQHRGWKGVMLDQSNKNEEIGLYRRLVRANTIADLFKEKGVPKSFDLLSIDVDGNDFWFWRALLHAGYRPRGVVIEYLKSFGAEDIVARYADKSAVTYARNDARNVAVTGASMAALVKLGAQFGYRLVKKICCDDVFFVRGDLAPSLETLHLEDMDAKALQVGPHLEPYHKDIIQALLSRHDDFFTTAAAASLQGGTSTIDVPADIREDCLSEAMGKLCDDELTGRLCYARWD